MVQEKKCGDCSVIKPVAAFSPKHKGKYAHSKAGYSSDCKDCINEARKKYRLLNPGKVAESDTNSRLKRVYGIDLARYHQMLQDQDEKCPGCKRHQSEVIFKFAVDHCHETNNVRGLLCINCNAILGQARDSIQVLENLSGYLNKTKINSILQEKVGYYGGK